MENKKVYVIVYTYFNKSHIYKLYAIDEHDAKSLFYMIHSTHCDIEKIYLSIDDNIDADNDIINTEQNKAEEKR